MRLKNHLKIQHQLLNFLEKHEIQPLKKLKKIVESLPGYSLVCYLLEIKDRLFYLIIN